MHAEKIGRVVTLIIRKNAEEATAMVQKYDPLFVDAIPLTLEEIFIYELGGDKNGSSSTVSSMVPSSDLSVS